MSAPDEFVPPAVCPACGSGEVRDEPDNSAGGIGRKIYCGACGFVITSYWSAGINQAFDRVNTNVAGLLRTLADALDAPIIGKADQLKQARDLAETIYGPQFAAHLDALLNLAFASEQRSGS